MNVAEKIFVAIPAFNAGATLPKVLRGVIRHVPRSRILVIDDGSSDDTAQSAENFGVLLQRHALNLGKGAALKTAFRYLLRETSAQSVITLDADLQHLPDDIPKFVHAFSEEKSDLVIGARSFSTNVMPVFRVVSNTMTSKLLSWKTGLKVKDSQSGYRLHSRCLLERLQLKTSGYETESEILLQVCRNGLKLSFVPIATIYNGETSHIRGLRDSLRFIKLYLEN